MSPWNSVSLPPTSACVGVYANRSIHVCRCVQMYIYIYTYMHIYSQCI